MFNIWRRLRKEDYLLETCDLFIATWFRQTWLHHICNHVKRALENGHLLGNSLIKPEAFQTKLGCNALHVTLIYIDLQYYNAHQATIIECARKFDISNMSLRIFFLLNATCYLSFFFRSIVWSCKILEEKEKKLSSSILSCLYFFKNNRGFCFSFYRKIIKVQRFRSR